MSDQLADALRTEKKLQRAHILTPLVKSWVVLGALVAIIVKEVIEGNVKNLSGIGWGWPVVVLTVSLALGFVAGLVGWYATRYIVDDDEFRVEQGIVTKSSKRVPFNRIQAIDVHQPFIARMLGLAVVQISAGADSVKLEYLRRRQADDLRTFLIRRCAEPGTSPAVDAGTGDCVGHDDCAGHDDCVAGPATSARPTAPILHDHDAEVLVRLGPRPIVLGLLLSSDFLISLAAAATGLTVMVVLGWWWLAAPLVLPAAIGSVSMLAKRGLNQFNYTLSRGDASALRISRGLAALTSQTVPVHRVQGIQLHQSWLWRRWGLWKVDIDILRDPLQQLTDEAGSLLLPAAELADVRIAVDAIWPGINWEHPDWRPVSPRARWLRPLSHKKMRWALTDELAISSRGWLATTIELVPHAKAQSVRTTQGPLQRRLGLASIHVDTTPGPVSLSVNHLDPNLARDYLADELDRSRAARQRGVAWR